MHTVPSREGFAIHAFREIFKEVTDLYNAFIFDTMRRSGETFSIPHATVLSAAFACIFLELRFVSVLVLFADIKNIKNGEGSYGFLTHHVLIWKSDLFVIDITPIDGFPAISLPQAIIQTKTRKRFFVLPELDQSTWTFEKQVAFDKEVESLVEILTLLKKQLKLRLKLKPKMPL